MADSPHRRHSYGKLRREESSQRSEANASRQHTLIAASVMKESINIRLPVRQSTQDVHNSNAQPIEANRGILAGCAFA
eukprot:4123174-Heterocapsa_arctica.AAC.1